MNSRAALLVTLAVVCNAVACSSEASSVEANDQAATEKLGVYWNFRNADNQAEGLQKTELSLGFVGATNLPTPVVTRVDGRCGISDDPAVLDARFGTPLSTARCQFTELLHVFTIYHDAANSRLSLVRSTFDGEGEGGPEITTVQTFELPANAEVSLTHAVTVTPKLLIPTNEPFKNERAIKFDITGSAYGFFSTGSHERTGCKLSEERVAFPSVTGAQLAAVVCGGDDPTAYAVFQQPGHLAAFKAPLDASGAVIAARARPLPDFDSGIETSDSGDPTVDLLPEQSNHVSTAELATACATRLEDDDGIFEIGGVCH
jgi:hypothetical protein